MFSKAHHCTQMLAIAGVVAMTVFSTMSVAQSVYKYRDSKGNWVYTDQKPRADVSTEQITLKTEPIPPRIAVERIMSDKGAVLRAINECSCTVEFGLRLIDPRNVVVSQPGDIHAVLLPHADKTLTEITPNGLGDPTYRYEWGYVIGAPGAQHRPAEPYRVPYAVGQSFRVTQAYPSSITHTTPSSRYAVDIALPEQTPVYAARAGRVVNVAHNNFRGGITPAMAEEANFVEIVHDDDTVAMYAHLHWDSIRVHAGQTVQRGEYIADSGNTGFSSGPHLHFAVARNVGLKMESVPVTFAGRNGEPITPQSGMMLKSY